MTSRKVDTIENDPIINYLTSISEDHRGSDGDIINGKEVAKYLLYCNSNGSGLDKMREGAQYTEGFQSLLNLVGGGANVALTTKSVSMIVRIRFAIVELINLLDILGLVKLQVKLGRPPVNETDFKMGLKFVTSARSLVKKAFGEDLPTIIEECYKIKFGSSGSFPYSLAEVKKYSVRQNIMAACYGWIYDKLGRDRDAMDFISDNKEAYNKKMWFEFSGEKHQILPQNLLRLIKDVVSLASKVVYNGVHPETFSAVDSYSKAYHVGENQKLSKSEYQSKLFKGIKSTFKFDGNNSTAFGHLVNFSKVLKIDNSVVFLDSFDEQYNMERIQGVFSFLNDNRSFANNRILNSIFKFISKYYSSQSDFLKSHEGLLTRKQIPPEIELALLNYGNLDKMKTDFHDLHPNIVFSQVILDQSRSDIRYTNQQIKSGYLQQGFMSLKASMKEEHNSGGSDVAFEKFANMFTEIVNMYELSKESIFKGRKQQETDAAKLERTRVKIQKENGIKSTAASPPVQKFSAAFGSTSPSAALGLGARGNNEFELPQVSSSEQSATSAAAATRTQNLNFSEPQVPLIPGMTPGSRSVRSPNLAATLDSRSRSQSPSVRPSNGMLDLGGLGDEIVEALPLSNATLGSGAADARSPNLRFNNSTFGPGSPVARNAGDDFSF
jgi:hypothetical protein